MKNLITLLTILLLGVSVFAQVPEKMSYQAVIRDSDNEMVINQSVGMQISILQTFPDGAAVYIETHTTETNANGLLSIEIGDGIPVTGDFAAINWSAGPYFIKTETDPLGETNYTITGISELLSVPYAMHSSSSETLIGVIAESQITDLQNYLLEEDDPLFTTSVASNITQEDIESWDSKSEFDGEFDNLSGVPDYLLEETDPLFTTSVASGIETNDTTNWNEAYTWGNHTEADYLTEETDPLFTTSVASNITQEDTINWNAKSEFDGDFNNLSNIPTFMPAGVINMFAGGVVPDGYFICDGSEVSRTEYADLFAAIGTTYGDGDGTTTFNLPNLQSRVPVGMSTDPEFNQLGNTGGAVDHTLTTNEMPSHAHTGSTGLAGYHSHSGSIGTAGNHAHSANTTLSGMVKPVRLSPSPHFTKSPYTTAGEDRYVGQGNNENYPYNPSASTTISSAGAHSHSVSIANGGNHEHSVSINNSGGGGAHNNLQPYIVINFIIKY